MQHTDTRDKGALDRADTDQTHVTRVHCAAKQSTSPRASSSPSVETSVCQHAVQDGWIALHGTPQSHAAPQLDHSARHTLPTKGVEHSARHATAGATGAERTAILQEMYAVCRCHASSASENAGSFSSAFRNGPLAQTSNAAGTIRVSRPHVCSGTLSNSRVKLRNAGSCNDHSLAWKCRVFSTHSAKDGSSPLLQQRASWAVTMDCRPS